MTQNNRPILDEKSDVSIGYDVRERSTGEDPSVTIKRNSRPAPISATHDLGRNDGAAISAHRPIILTFTGSYLPGFKAGGPIRSLANMVDCLGDEFNFRIVTQDRDLGDPAAYSDIQVNCWNTVGKAEVFYRSPGSAGWRALVADIQRSNYDLIYLNSFFSIDASLRPLLYRALGRLKKKPVLLAPRGEFSQGALALKPFKKSLFIGLVRHLNIYRDVSFQASSEHEAADIRHALGSARGARAGALVVSDLRSAKGPVSSDAGAGIYIASNLAPPRTVANIAATERDTSRLKAVFLSRISPMKNLDGALSVLSKIECPLKFDIYGPIEDEGYWKRCLTLIRDLPNNVTAEYKGKVDPTSVSKVLSCYDFLFLPTHGENYGHVIREALSAGLPVLISDQTPWRNLTNASAGADLPLSERNAFVAWIDKFSRLPAVDRKAMQIAARQLGDDAAKASHDLEANRVMFLTVSGYPVGWSKPG